MRSLTSRLARSSQHIDKHSQRSEKLASTMCNAEPGSDDLMHPNRVLATLRDAQPADTIVIADGDDFLSFARVGLPATTYLDPGSPDFIGTPPS